MVVFLNGKFLAAEKAKISVFDHGFLYGDGCFETLRTYHGKIFRVEAHLERLKKSLALLQIKIPWKDAEIKQWIEKTLEKNQYQEARLRITITRGENNFDFCGAQNPSILIVVTELIPHQKAVFEKGVAVATLEIERVLPQIKSLNLLPSILGQQIKKEKKVFETIFIDHNGFLTEGTVSNFFIVQKDLILTAPTNNVLSGITRDLVFEIAKQAKIKVAERLFSLQDLDSADEAFLSSTIMDIAPVIQVGEKKIAQGEVGKITKKLMKAFAQETFLKEIAKN